MAKLLFLVTEDWYFVSHRLPLAKAAKDGGFDVVVATRLETMSRVIEAARIRAIPFEMSRRGTNPLSELGTLIRLWRLYRREQPDIVHHVALKPVVLGGLAARLAGVHAVVAAVAGMGFLFAGEGRLPWVRAGLLRLLPWVIGSGRAIVQNPEDAALLDSHGVPHGRIRLIRGAGVDPDRFRILPEVEDVPLVVLPARMLWDKGVGEFAAAAGMLRQRGIAARFALVGEGDADNPASVPQATLEGWRAEGLVEWWGRRDDMPKVLAQAHVVCLPSYREGLPKALLEAAASGRAIVTCDVPGCREVVRHQDNGLLVPPRDAGALADALERLILDAGLRRQMGRRGRERAEAEFSQERVIAETLAVYRELLAA